jgi:hypothetical protein
MASEHEACVMRFPTNAPAGVVPARNVHFQYLAEHMREDEKQHWLAMSGANSYNSDVAAAGFMLTNGMRMTLLGVDGMPVIAGGFVPSRGNSWDGWMVGSIEGWDKEWRSITKAVRWLMGEMFRAGATRLSITTLASRHEALDWYEKALGMECEGTLRCAGSHGEDLVIYSRIKGDGL